MFFDGHEPSRGQSEGLHPSAFEGYESFSLPNYAAGNRAKRIHMKDLCLEEGGLNPARYCPSMDMRSDTPSNPHTAQLRYLGRVTVFRLRSVLSPEGNGPPME